MRTGKRQCAVCDDGGSQQRRVYAHERMLMRVLLRMRQSAREAYKEHARYDVRSAMSSERAYSDICYGVAQRSAAAMSLRHMLRCAVTMPPPLRCLPLLFLPPCLIISPFCYAAPLTLLRHIR